MLMLDAGDWDIRAAVWLLWIVKALESSPDSANKSPHRFNRE